MAMITMMDLLMIDNQVFVLLVAEMSLFMLLVVPMPFTVRRKMFTYVHDEFFSLPFFFSYRVVD